MSIRWSAAALLVGWLLDLWLGDPPHFPHIVRVMGSLIAALEKKLRKALPATTGGEKAGGILLVVITAALCTGIPAVMLHLSYRLFTPLGFALECMLCYQLLAAKSLKTESMKVYVRLVQGDVAAARQAVSMIVGRDTEALDAQGITRAAVETVAENTSDGVVAPLLYMLAGGAALGCLYKAVNTMDSMVGYQTDTYRYFGRAAARLDDVLNLLPSRLCALLMIAAAALLGYDYRAAFRIWCRDRRKHASPNSAQTEAVCAGALGIRLGGPAIYFGKLHNKPAIGDDLRPVTPEDIVHANRLMYTASLLLLLPLLPVRLICWGVL